jgi:Ankyrin repeats (many copies)
MKLELKFNEIILLAIVILLSVAANLPESLIGRYINTDILLSVLAGVVIIALFRYLRWMLFLTVTVLAFGANLPDQIASVVKVEPIVLIATLIVLVLVSLLNHVFKLLPTDAKTTRTDSSQSRVAVLEAVKTGNLSKLNHLLQMNVAIDFIQDGTSPAHIVAEQGNNEMMQALIEYGVNLNVINKDGLTPMEVAMAFGFNHTAEMMRSAGKADVAQVA